MGNDISTVYLYTVQKPDTTATDDDITTAIDIAGSLLQNYLDRSLEVEEYQEWIDGTGDSSLLTKQWPINRVYQVSSSVYPLFNVKINAASDVSLVTLDIGTAGVGGTYWYPGGTEQDIDGYDTVQELLDFLDAEVDGDAELLFDTSLLNSAYSGIIAEYLKTDKLQLVNSDTSVYGLYETQPSRFSVDSLTNRSIYTDFPMANGINNVFLWYSAGYTYPVDNVDHSALTVAGNVPDDLIATINNIAGDVLTTYTKDTGAVGKFKSESQGKYSYTLREYSSDIEKSTAYLTNPVLKYESILSRYKKLSLTRVA